jgi:release factor glutamine methyltransferase
MPEVLKQWRILDLIKVSEETLRLKAIANPRLNAELLLADTLKTSRINLYLDFEKPLTDSELTEFREKIKRRLKHEPLQYIRGFSEFYGMRFKVNSSVLIPRPETELLVEKCIEAASKFTNPKILEIGTGSGCISIAVASKTECSIDAIDINDEALVIAQENSGSNHTKDKINFANMDFLSDFSEFGKYDIVISNPPYIPKNEFEDLMPEVRDYEPEVALTDSGDGLGFYRKIFDCAKSTSKPLHILLEIGDGKKEIIEKLVEQYGFTSHNFHNDMMNIPRVLEINTGSG